MASRPTFRYLGTGLRHVYKEDIPFQNIQGSIHVLFVLARHLSAFSVSYTASTLSPPSQNITQHLYFIELVPGVLSRHVGVSNIPRPLCVCHSIALEGLTSDV